MTLSSFILGIPSLFIGLFLSTLSWRQADQMVHEAFDEVKAADKWDGSALMQ